MVSFLFWVVFSMINGFIFVLGGFFNESKFHLFYLFFQKFDDPNRLKISLKFLKAKFHVQSFQNWDGTMTSNIVAIGFRGIFFVNQGGQYECPLSHSVTFMENLVWLSS
jgi:hypothetical protein